MHVLSNMLLSPVTYCPKNSAKLSKFFMALEMQIQNNSDTTNRQNYIQMYFCLQGMLPWKARFLIDFDLAWNVLLYF